MNKSRWILGWMLVGMLAGCGTKAAPTVEPILNVRDNNENPIQGVYVVVSDPDIKRLHREVKTSSLMCSSQFNLDVGTPMHHSLNRTMDNVFGTVIFQDGEPTPEELNRLGATAAVHLKLQEFQTKLDFSSSLVKEKASATVSITLGATVSDPAGKQLNYSGGASRVVHGEDGGSDCEIGAMAMARAIHQTMREALDSLANSLNNAPELRKLSRH